MPAASVLKTVVVSRRLITLKTHTCRSAGKVEVNNNGHAFVCGERLEVIEWIVWKGGTTWKPKLWESAAGARYTKITPRARVVLSRNWAALPPPPGQWQRLKYVAMSIPISQVTQVYFTILDQEQLKPYINQTTTESPPEATEQSDELDTITNDSCNTINTRRLPGN